MSKPFPVNDENFDQMVLKSDKPVLVDFWATWCKPCAMVAPIVDELAGEYDEKVVFTKLDVDGNPKIASRYGVMSIPTLLIFKNGQPVTNIVGFKPKEELVKSLESVLKK